MALLQDFIHEKKDRQAGGQTETNRQKTIEISRDIQKDRKTNKDRQTHNWRD